MQRRDGRDQIHACLTLIDKRAGRLQIQIAPTPATMRSTELFAPSWLI